MGDGQVENGNYQNNFRKSIEDKARDEARKILLLDKKEQIKARESIAKELERDLKEIETLASKVVKEETDNKSKGKVPLSPEGAKAKMKVLQTFYKVIEYIKKGVVDSSLISKTEEGAFLLKEIAESEEIYSNPDMIPYLYSYLGDFIFQDRPLELKAQAGQETDFQKALDNLINSDPTVARYFLEILGKGISSGRIKNISRADFDNFIYVNRDKLASEESGRQATRPRRMTLQDIKDLKEITFQIAKSLEAKRSELSPEDIRRINLALVYQTRLPSELSKALVDLGLTNDLIERYNEIKENYFAIPDFSYLESWAPALASILNEAKKEFSDLTAYFSEFKDGQLTLSREMKLKFADLIKKYYYLVLKPVLADRSKPFHENFSHHTEVQYALSVLRQLISFSCQRIREILPKDSGKNYDDIVQFLEDKGESFQARIFSYTSMFHDLPLYIRNLGAIEKIKDFFSFLFPSEIAEFFDDETGFMQIARDTLSLMIREHLVEGKNQYRGDFLSGKYIEEGVRWSQLFRDKYREKIRELGKKFNLINEDEEWKVDMIVLFSEGIGIATLIDPEILITSDPVPHFREVHPIMSFLSAKHNWRGGRGQDAPGKISKFLLHMDVDLLPENRRSWLERMWSKKRWVPEEFANLVDKGLKTYGEKIVKQFLNLGSAYQELISMFNLPNSINSWNGWRIEGMIPTELNKVLNILGLSDYGSFWKSDLNETEYSNKWQEIFYKIGQIYGTSGIWQSIGGVVGGAGVNRLNSELKRFFVDCCKGDINRADFEFKEFFDEVRKNSGNRGLEKIFEFKDRPGEKFTFFEVRQIRLTQLRGEAFFRYLRRNPADFLMLVTQVCPDLLDDKGTIFLDETSIESLSGKTKLEKELLLARQKELKIKWGEHFETLKKIHKWLIDNKGNKSIIDFIKEFNEVMISAYNRRKISEERTRREILRIVSDGSIPESEKKNRLNALFNELSFYLRREDLDGDEKERFWNLFAGEGGLFETLTGMKFHDADNFFSKFGSYSTAGKKNFFFVMANNWFVKNAEVNPFAADIAYYDVFKQIGTPGESTFARLIDANITNYKEVVTKIINLEEILFEVAQTGKMDKIYDLHAKIDQTLGGLVGQEYARRANFILAQIVTKFFMERSILRDPKLNWLLGPLAWLARGVFGKNVSLSKILTNNVHAFSMDSERMREYFMYLSHYTSILPQKGIWSREHLEKIFEVELPYYLFGEASPQFVWFFILFLLFSNIKKAIESESKGRR